MRATISCTTHLTNNYVVSILDEISWLPYIDQLEIDESPEIEKIRKDTIKRHTAQIETINLQRENILREFSDHDLVCRENTFCTIYDTDTKTWGIVNRITKYKIEFRLINYDSSDLKKACGNLVTMLRSNIPKNLLGLSNLQKVIHPNNKIFVFSTYIHVLQGNREAFHGTILNENLLKAATLQKKREVWLIVVAGVTSIILLILTSPVCYDLFEGGSSISREWGLWLSGIFHGLSSAALVTCSISILELFLYRQQLKREAPIIWSSD